MADTYFEVRNNENVFQFSDTTHLLHIVDSKTIEANGEKGEIYGIEIPKGISGVTYSTREGRIYVSPEAIKDGKRIQYVQSAWGSPIKVYFWSEDYFPEMEHGAGLELRDAKGNVVFNNQGYLGSFKKSFYSSITTYQKLVAIDGEDRQLRGESDVYNTWFAPGFPMLYMALAAKHWGLWWRERIEYKRARWWKKPHRYGYFEAYGFGTMQGKPNDHDNMEYHWSVEPDRYSSASKTIDWAFKGNTPESYKRYWRFNGQFYEYYDESEWKREHSNETPSHISNETTDIIGDIAFAIHNKWDCVVSSSASLMCPMNIWIPSLIGPIEKKDTCYAIGYDFTSIEGKMHIKLADEFGTLKLKKLRGAGSLEHLNTVVQSQTETKLVTPKGTKGATEDIYDTKTWAISDGLACDISMTHIVDIM